MDYKLKCLGCGREFMLPRIKAQKKHKKRLRKKENE
ncbi:MAG: DUF951 domain-containing protein [Anaerotruncus sp.]|nr:MAG: DUF951 domain-containing protein [Anaerotruncus sp.]